MMGALTRADGLTVELLFIRMGINYLLSKHRLKSLAEQRWTNSAYTSMKRYPGHNRCINTLSDALVLASCIQTHPLEQRG